MAVHMQELKNRVFVYGTLKQGNSYHSFLLDENNGKAMFVGAAQISEKYPLILSTAYKVPFLLCSPGHGKVVRGEVYDVNDAMLKSLDDFESHPTFYLRQEVAVEPLTSDQYVNGADKFNAWAYLLPGFRAHLLELPTHSTYDPAMYPDQRGVPLPFPPEVNVEKLENIKQDMLQQVW